MNEALPRRHDGRPRPLSRADLAWALGERGQSGLEAMAALAGFTVALPEPLPSLPRETPTRPSLDPAPTPSPEAYAPIPFWRLEKVVHLEDDEAPPQQGLAPLTAADVGPLELKESFSPPELAPWPALHRALLTALRTDREGRRVDVPRLVKAWSRARMVARLPRRRAAAWSSRLTLLLDRSHRLAAVRDDQTELSLRLLATYGDAALSFQLRLAECPWLWTDGRTWGRRELPPVEPGEPVLALTDLGFVGEDAAERAFWEELGRALRAAEARPWALIPLPASRWPGAEASAWNLLAWPQGSGRRERGSEDSDSNELDRRRERLLTLLALAVRIEPGLLREARQLLGPDADVGTEGDAWRALGAGNHSVVAGRLERGLTDRLRGEWAKLPEEERAASLRVLKRWHASLAREIWYEEVLAAEALGALPPGFEEDLAEARRFALRLGATHRASGPVSGEILAASKAWLLRFGERVPVALWQDRELGPALGPVLAAALKERGEETLPPGFSLRWATGEGPPRRWVAWQVGQELRLRPEGDQGTPAERGAPLATMVTTSPEVAIAAQAGGRSELLGLDEGGAARALPVGPFVLKSDRQELHFTRYQREPWATAAGRDKYGLWAAFEVEGVEHRFRWIPLGRFWMGSPESEQGRWGDEGPRHLVTLTQGFWLGEAPVTQALWQVVMGENPSYFVSPDRPVEQVSWEQCQEFLRRLEGKDEAKHLGARLPWEAEWEYACRAGTETSTWAGVPEICGKANAPLLGTIAWYRGNSGVDFELDNGVDSSAWEEKQYNHSKAGTHPVKHRPANPWGLYDMLGNVWEWCADHWVDQYPSEATADPRGPASGLVYVMRGGSWFDVARHVRAASRLRDSSALDNHHLGFRLARGQGAQPVGGAPEPAGHPRGREAAASGEGRGTRALRPRAKRRNRNRGIRRVPGDQGPKS